MLDGCSRRYSRGGRARDANCGYAVPNVLAGAHRAEAALRSAVDPRLESDRLRSIVGSTNKSPEARYGEHEPPHQQQRNSATTSTQYSVRVFCRWLMRHSRMRTLPEHP